MKLFYLIGTEKMAKNNINIQSYLKKFLEDLSLRNRQILFILALIILLAFLLRIYTLSTESLWVDEVISVDAAKRSIASIIVKESSERAVHPPFYYIILHFWMKLFGDSEFSVRFPSVIFGVASIYVIYRVGKLIYSKEVGVISAFLLSISLFHIRYSQETRFYALLTFLILLSNFYFVKLLKEKNIKNAGAYVILTTAMVYTHVFGLFYIIFQNIYYLLIFRKNMKFWIAVQGLVLFLFAPWIPVLVKQTTKVGNDFWWIPHPTYLSIFNTFKSFAGSEVSLYLFIILGVTGIIFIYRQEFNDRIFLLLWLSVPIITSFLISLIKPIYIDRYLIGSLPAIILLISKGIFNFRKSLMILILLIAITISTIYPLEKYYAVPEKWQWRDAASYIENNKGSNDYVLLYYTNKPQPTTPFSYYYKNDTNFAMVTKAYQIKNFTKYDGIWLAFSHLWSQELMNESKSMEKTLSETHTRRYTIDFVKIKLNYYIANLAKNYEVDQVQLNQSKVIYLTGNYTKVAQYIIPEMKELDAVQLRVARSSDEIKVYIQTDNNGIPSGNTIGNVSIINPYIYTNFTAKVGKVELKPGNKYWIIVERTKGNISLYGEDASKNKTFKIHNSTNGIWRYSTQGNGIYFKTLILNETK